MSGRPHRHIMSIAAVLLCVAGVHASEHALSTLTNFRAYSERLASSGQPAADQLELLRDAGFERIVYLAYTDSQGALGNEDQLAEQLGIEFAQVPVNWDAPLKQDFYTFAAILNQAPELRTLVHCQVNFRASTFSFLYRVLHRDVPVDVAKSDLESVWVPNETWQALIFEILDENGIDPDCDACIWAHE